MTDSTRMFILGAGFSKPAGMPLATEVLPLLVEQLQVDEMCTWPDPEDAAAEKYAFGQAVG